MSAMHKTPGHRARELLNLIQWAACCAALPEADEAEQAAWRGEVRRAWDELQGLWPQLRAHSGDAEPAEPLADGLSRALAACLDDGADRGAVCDQLLADADGRRSAARRETPSPAPSRALNSTAAPCASTGQAGGAGP